MAAKTNGSEQPCTYSEHISFWIWTKKMKEGQWTILKKQIVAASTLNFNFLGPPWKTLLHCNRDRTKLSFCGNASNLAIATLPEESDDYAAVQKQVAAPQADHDTNKEL